MRLIGPLILGIAGVAVLVSLGVWQTNRLYWKQGILSEIESRIAAPGIDLPVAPDPVRDQYRAVAIQGKVLGPEIRVLVSRKQIGAGCRIVVPFDTGTRRVLLDRGFVRQTDCRAPRPQDRALSVEGNLLWPDEIDSFTPAPEADWATGDGLWFARDLPAMARALETEPLLIVARAPTGDGIEPLPVSIEGIPNDHLNYAITWFSLAAVWAGMTGFLLWRISRRA